MHTADTTVRGELAVSFSFGADCVLTWKLGRDSREGGGTMIPKMGPGVVRCGCNGCNWPTWHLIFNGLNGL